MVTDDPFMTSTDTPDVGPIFSARFDSECETCGYEIAEGDQIRISDGMTECERCIASDR